MDIGFYPSITPSIHRLYVVGITGSGKSTLANELARRLDLLYVQMDALDWGSNWIHCRDGEFRGRVENSARGCTSVAGGNYAIVRGPGLATR